MLHFIVYLAIAIWSTSSLFMLAFWANTFITFWKEERKIFIMPISLFLYFHFCPIVHTIECFKIMKRIKEIQERRV